MKITKNFLKLFATHVRDAESEEEVKDIIEETKDAVEELEAEATPAETTVVEETKDDVATDFNSYVEGLKNFLATVDVNQLDEGSKALFNALNSAVNPVKDEEPVVEKEEEIIEENLYDSAPEDEDKSEIIDAVCEKIEDEDIKEKVCDALNGILGNKKSYDALKGLAKDRRTLVMDSDDTDICTRQQKVFDSLNPHKKNK